MIVTPPKFKVGDDCIVETYTSRLSQGLSLAEREFARGKIIYAHPVHGWSTYRALGYNMAMPNGDIMTVKEYNDAIKSIKNPKPLR